MINTGQPFRRPKTIRRNRPAADVPHRPVRIVRLDRIAVLRRRIIRTPPAVTEGERKP
jgi:hypothetical protein